MDYDPEKLDSSDQKKWRLVRNYRKLNEKTIDNRYPIPNTDILDKLGRCMYFKYYIGPSIRFSPIGSRESRYSNKSF